MGVSTEPPNFAFLDDTIIDLVAKISMQHPVLSATHSAQIARKLPQRRLAVASPDCKVPLSVLVPILT